MKKELNKVAEQYASDYFEQCGYNGYHKTYIGTIEPRYNDSRVFLNDDKYICDDALAFIYGAIKKYGTDKNALTDLKAYISYMATRINKND